MTRPRFYRQSQGYGLFHLGIETYRYEEEIHHNWGGSSTGDSYRVWTIHLGFWSVDWTTR